MFMISVTSIIQGVYFTIKSVRSVVKCETSIMHLGNKKNPLIIFSLSSPFLFSLSQLFLKFYLFFFLCLSVSPPLSLSSFSPFLSQG